VSIGYKGVPLTGLEQWYDDRKGIITNKGGKIDGASSSLGGLYVSGWLKRGPRGIIGTNIMDAKVGKLVMRCCRHVGNTLTSP
jgi:NADPH-dependent glutamate synthase beta subunit-like oxidoreductase